MSVERVEGWRARCDDCGSGGYIHPELDLAENWLDHHVCAEVGEPVTFHVTVDLFSPPTLTVDGRVSWGHVAEASAALSDASRCRFTGDNVSAAVDVGWRRRQEYAADELERRVRVEIDNPYRCECGRRFKTERGMAMHRSRSRYHRREVES